MAPVARQEALLGHNGDRGLKPYLPHESAGVCLHPGEISHDLLSCNTSNAAALYVIEHVVIFCSEDGHLI